MCDLSLSLSSSHGKCCLVEYKQCSVVQNDGHCTATRQLVSPLPQSVSPDVSVTVSGPAYLLRLPSPA
jgi:hypothetical protein